MTAKIARQFTWISVERYAGEVLEVYRSVLSRANA